MKLIKPSFKIINQEDNLEGIYEAIENAGRTCYKSIGTRYFKIPLSGSNMPEVWHYVHENIACYTKVEGDGVHSQILNGYVSIADKDVKNFEGLDKYECEFNPKYHKNITAKDFTERMIKSGHLAMLEFGTVYLKYDLSAVYKDDTEVYLGSYFADFYKNNKYSKITLNNTILYVTTNYRVIIENCKLDDLAYLCEPTEFHEKRIFVRFITDRGVSHELVRHRVFSFAQESTRYCNYSKDKFGNELTFIIPSWCTLEEGKYSWHGFNYLSDDYWCGWRKDSEPKNIEQISELGKTIIERMANYHWLLSNLKESEKDYKNLLLKYTPQQARQVLPNALKTEINMCGFVSDWKHFFSLRSSHAGATGMHPDMDYIANKIYDEFLKRKYIN